jgi:hypothetical protein
MTQSKLSDIFQNINQLIYISWERQVKTACLTTLTHFITILGCVKGFKLNFSLVGSLFCIHSSNFLKFQ